MPIRHCQKCSLKVLIDESQANVSPFYCQRCTAALKSEAVASPTPAQGNRRASSPKLTPVPAPAAVAVAAPPAGKTSTVKVFCPYCKASFNGKIPAKPARGSCPLCQKDLILLPTGDIRPAADFDLAKWQAEQEAGGGDDNGKESDTMVLVKKYAASPTSPASVAEAGKKIIEEKADAPAPAQPEETAVVDDGVELPGWLDETDRKKRASAPVTAPPETDTAAEPVRLEDLDPPAPPPPPPPPPPKRAATPAPPPPKPAPRPVTSSVPVVSAAPAKKAALKREKTERRVAPAAAEAVEAGPSGAGKFLLSLVLTALPVAAAPILLSMKENLGFLPSLAPRFAKGFKELDAKLFPPVEVEAPPPPAPKPKDVEPEAPAKPTAEDARQMEEEINKRWMEYKREERTVRQLSVGATAAQKAEIQKAEADLKEKKARIDQLRESYRKAFGKDYDPAKQ